MDGKNCWLRVVLCSTHTHTYTHTHTHRHTSWWIDITGNQIDLKRQWFIKRNGAYNMLWTTGPTPSTTRPAGEGSFWTEKKKAAMKRASEKRKKTLNAIPSGFTPWPPPPESDRLSSASRSPPRHTRTREHIIILYSTDEFVCVCFENTSTSRFARFSISPFDFSPSSDCVTLGRCTVVSYYCYIIDNMAPRINIVGTKPCPIIIFYYYHYK